METVLWIRESQRCRTRIALHLLHDTSGITRWRLIKSESDQDAAYRMGNMRENRPDVRKGEIRIVGSIWGRYKEKESWWEVVRSTMSGRSGRRNRHLDARVLYPASSGPKSPKLDTIKTGRSWIRLGQDTLAEHQRQPECTRHRASCPDSVATRDAKQRK